MIDADEPGFLSFGHDRLQCLCCPWGQSGFVAFGPSTVFIVDAISTCSDRLLLLDREISIHPVQEQP